MKKILNITKSIFTWILVIAAVAMMLFTIISVNTFDHTDRDLFGYKAFIVLTDSMSAVDGDPDKGYFSAGDLALIKEVDPATIQAGDIIAYTSTNTENYGKTVTHMVKAVVTDANGNPGFITYGTSTGAEDEKIVTYGYVLGKYTGHIPKIGTFFQFLKTTPGYIVCILLPFLLLIAMQGYDSVRLFKQYKAEQLALIAEEREKEKEALASEREALREERMRQEEMMQKLLQMQAQLQGEQAADAKAESAEETGGDSAPKA